jgi:chemotaxis protein MotB
MAGGKDTVIIIKKKKGGGHAAPHGGAWKVAYADFVTAMMAFFLVMWLMGVDEETKAAIAHYFNHPNSPYQGGHDPKSGESYPLGEKTGNGDNILSGEQGALPEDLVQEPMRPQNEAQRNLKENEDISDVIKRIFDIEAYGVEVNIDYIKFSIPNSLLFEMETTQLKPTANKYLERLGALFHNYKGYVNIAGHTEQNQDAKSSNFELSLSQAVAIMHFLVENNYGPEEKFFPTGDGDRRKFTTQRGLASDARVLNERMEFTLSRTRDP